MAGTHQIWVLFLDNDSNSPIRWWKDVTYPPNTCLCIAGSGREENRNNQYPLNAGFAQPSGLAVSVKTFSLYIADSESSTVRKVDIGTFKPGQVSAVVGGDINPNNLFAFGDKDGAKYEAKLQHALGITIHSDGITLFVADTYNHKIKLINTTTNTIETLQAHESIDRNLAFNEPSGLVFNNGNLFVADTNNHCIKVIELISDSDRLLAKSIKTMALKDKLIKGRDTIDNMNINIIKCIDSVKIDESGGKVIMKFDFVFEDGLKLTENVPQTWEVNIANLMWSSKPSNGKVVNEVDMLISIPPKAIAIGSQAKCFIDVEFNLITCTEDSCFPKNFVVRKYVQFEANTIDHITEYIKIKLTPNTVLEQK